MTSPAASGRHLSIFKIRPKMPPPMAVGRILVARHFARLNQLPNFLLKCVESIQISNLGWPTLRLFVPYVGCGNRKDAIRVRDAKDVGAPAERKCIFLVEEFTRSSSRRSDEL